MLFLNPIDNKTVVDRIVKQITDAIIEGKLKPGDKIPTEVGVIENLGVGRNSVREAIKMLSALGVLEIRRGDGTYIARKVLPSIFNSLVYSIILEQSTREEILELREALEIDILELAVDKAVPDDIKKLEDLLDEFRKVFEKKDFEEAASLDLKFHYALIDACRNPLLGRISKGVLQMFYPSVKETLKNYEIHKGTFHKCHEEMVEAIKKKDKQNVGEIVRKSLKGWKEFI